MANIPPPMLPTAAGGEWVKLPSGRFLNLAYVAMVSETGEVFFTESWIYEDQAYLVSHQLGNTDARALRRYLDTRAEELREG